VRVEDLERRHRVVDGAQGVVERAVRTRERLLEHEGELDLDPHVREAVHRDLRARREDGVVEHHAVVRLADAGRLLHGLGRQSDLAADQAPAGREVLVAPHALDRVRVLHRRLGVARRDPGDDPVRAVGLGQLVGQRGDVVGMKHRLLLCHG
jgi:hypothetical protein